MGRHHGRVRATQACENGATAGLFDGIRSEADTMQRLTETLPNHGVDGRLQVTEEVVGLPELIGLIYHIIVFGLQICGVHRFSRLASVGAASRAMLAAFLLGINAMVSMNMEVPG